MSVHKDLMGFNIACDADDCAEANGTGVRAHVHFSPLVSEEIATLSPQMTGWILDFKYDESSPRNDFCPECAS